MLNQFIRNQVNWTFLLLIIFSSELLQYARTETILNPDLPQRRTNLNIGLSLQNANQQLSPLEEKSEDDFGLIEVKEDEIPENTEVYVSEEEEESAKIDGETLETASNVVFRPLFRYRGKQEAVRRAYGGIRRRYYVPKRYYRRVYYPYYYPYRYYYYHY